MRYIEIKDWLEKYQDEIRKVAKELFDTPMPKVNEDLFAIFEKTGSRIEYENVYCERRKYLSVFGCLSVFDNTDKYIQNLEMVIKDICEEECWALPAHVNGRKDPEWRNCVDLLASETAAILTELSVLLNGKLSDDISRLIRENVNRRIFIPYLSRQPYAEWENCEMNETVSIPQLSWGNNRCKWR